MYRMAILCGALLLSGCNYEVGDIPRQRSSVEETEVARERPVARTVGLTEGKTQPAPQKPQTQSNVLKDKLTPPARGEAPEVFALLMVKFRQPMLLRDDWMHAASLDEFNLYKRTQQVLVTSNFVILAALRRNDIPEIPMLKSRGNHAVRWLAGKVQVDFPNDAEIMRIGMSGENVEEMVRVVDAIQQAYLREVVDGERSHLLLRCEKLRHIWSRNEEKIHAKALVVATLKAASKDGAGDLTVPLDAAKRSLSHHIRFGERIRDELDQMNVNVDAPSRVVKLQEASR
ncbi:MAG: hypothetical protein IID44_21100 [Planctomycetes bacterium]|nr:hypothetical protein [Planctomycetota bacterium]